MKRKIMLSLAALVLFSVFAVMPFASPAQAAPARQLAGVPVSGTFTDALGGVGNFAGTLDIQRFTNVGGQLAAVGTLTGTLTDSLGNVIGTVTQAVTLAVNATGSCQILNLVLGPLDLDLLGLQVHLNQVVLNITAQSGAGNLLGNLLCAVANLLNSNSSATGLASLLNQILRILG